MKEGRHAAEIEGATCRKVPGASAREETMTRAEALQSLPLRGRMGSSARHASSASRVLASAGVGARSLRKTLMSGVWTGRKCSER